jgi:uncharacterized protein
MRFEWDAGNLEHIQEHGVTQIEAEESLQDKELVHVTMDVRSAEVRILVLGLTKKQRLLSVAFIVRDTRVRVVTARDASRKERKWYADHKASKS